AEGPSTLEGLIGFSYERLSRWSDWPRFFAISQIADDGPMKKDGPRTHEFRGAHALLVVGCRSARDASHDRVSIAAARRADPPPVTARSLRLWTTVHLGSSRRRPGRRPG